MANFNRLDRCGNLLFVRKVAPIVLSCSAHCGNLGANRACVVLVDNLKDCAVGGEALGGGAANPRRSTRDDCYPAIQTSHLKT